MSASLKTPNREYPLYNTANDTFDVGDYNAAVTKIDADIESFSGGSGGLETRVSTLESTVVSIESTLDTTTATANRAESKADVAGAKTTVNENSITELGNDLSAVSTRVSTIENEIPNNTNTRFEIMGGGKILVGTVNINETGRTAVTFNTPFVNRPPFVFMTLSANTSTNIPVAENITVDGFIAVGDPNGWYNWLAISGEI